VDKELRDALREFIADGIGEKEIERRMKEERESVGGWNDANRLHAGEKTREEVLDFLVSLDRDLEQFFREYHAEHGCYPEAPDFSGSPFISMHYGPAGDKTDGLNMPSLEAPVLQLRENDLGDCLDKVSKQRREEFEREGIKLEAEFDPSIPTFRFDYPRVQQVVANLLNNALTHTPSGGSVTLNCMLRPDGVEVSVTGALEHDQIILDGYSTVPRSRAQTFEESLAIGLTIAKRLILAHHGKIWVEASTTGNRYAFLMPMDQG
jgi:hypothetical protein